MAFRIQRTQGSLPGRASAVRANVDVDTGGQLVGRALQGLGGAVTDLGVKYDITQAQTQLSEFQRKANEENNRFVLSLDTNLDPETYRAEYKKSTEAVYSLMPKNARAARNAQLWLNAKEPSWSAKVDDARMARADDNWLAELFAKQATVSQTGQIGSFPTYIAEGVHVGRIDKSDAVKVLAATNKMAVRGGIVNLYRAGNYDAARDAVEASKIFTPEEKVALQKNIDTAERAKQTNAQIEQEAYINETHKLTLDSFSQDINDLSVLEKLPDNMKSYWEGKLGDRDKMIKAGKGDPFINVYDPAKYNSLRTIMEQEPKNLKESQIVDAVGYGLTVEQGQDLIERHRKLSRKDTPLTAPEARRGVSRINNAFKAGIIKHPDFIEDAVEGSEEEYQNSLLRDQMIDGLEDWLKESPRTPEEVRQHTVDMLKPYEAMAGQSFISRMMGNFSRQAWVFSNKDYRDAIESLNKDAQAEWAHTEKVSGEGFWKLKVLPDDFLRKWQSPNKILTPQVARIYKKWSHGDLEKAKAMAVKDGWKEPK